MGKILEYSNLGAPPADNDLLFMGDYSDDTGNPTTMRLAISDLNKKRNVDAADGNGLMLRDDGGNYGIFIKDGGNVGIGTNAPDYELDISGATDPTLGITAGAAGNAVIRFDQTTTQQATIGYDDTGDLLKFNNNSNFGGTSHLVINSDGNVGVGVADPTVSLDVSGDFEIVDGSYGIKIDASLANIEGIRSGGTSGPLHLNRSGGADIWFMYASATDFAGKIESTDKCWSIGSKSTAGAKLHVYESSGEDNIALQLENRVASGSPKSILKFTRTVGSTALEQQMIWDGTSLGIRNAADLALGSDSVNFSAGKLDVGATGFTRKFNVTDTNNIVANFNSSGVAGTRILIRNATDAGASVQNSLIAFPNNISGIEYANWMVGTHKDNSNPDNNYFMIHRSSQASPTEGQYIFNATTTANEMRLDTSGNVRFKGTMEASAYYDQGGNSVGNYCRGRFLQTFSIGIKADKTGPVFPALNTVLPGLSSLYEGYIDTTAKTPDAQYMSRAPHNGKLVQVDITVYFPPGQVNVLGNITPTLMFYSGSSLPSADGNSGMGTTNSAHKTTATLSDSTSYTLGYDTSTFTNTASVLEFSEGDYLAFSIDTNSTTGWFYPNVALTFEFEID
jgi:hypothetical protein